MQNAGREYTNITKAAYSNHRDNVIKQIENLKSQSDQEYQVSRVIQLSAIYLFIVRTNSV